MEQYLKETYFLDYSNAFVQSIVEPFRTLSTQEKIARLFTKVRDGWWYNPYTIFTKREGLRASFIAQRPEGHCVDKAILYITGLRALGIPSRLRLVKVANHIAVERLLERLGSNYIAPHGIVDVYVNGTWVKASNAFNKELCDKFNVPALEFDGSEDAILQAANREEKRFMEYLEDFGHFEDVPFDFILRTFMETYPSLYKYHQGKDKIEI